MKPPCPLMTKGCTSLLLSLAALLAAGCGSDTVETGEVEKQIEEQLSTATAEIASVSCPEEVEKEEGGRFECDAKLEGGGKAVVVVTQRDDKGREFAYEVKPGTMRLADDSVEPYLEQQIAAKGVKADVDCPDLVRVKEGESVTCSALTSGGREVRLAFTWEDEAGNVASSSVETQS